jgi:hypothetical protein
LENMSSEAPLAPYVTPTAKAPRPVPPWLDKIARIAMVFFAVFFLLTAILIFDMNQTNKNNCRFVFAEIPYNMPLTAIRHADFDACMFICNQNISNQFRTDINAIPQGNYQEND